jgi:glycosyltransferase involved in cell wall biosynthesis
LDISIVVPFFNEEKHIESCINALLSQDYPADRYEIIMVDNNSTDRSVEIVEKYPEVRLYSEKRRGDFTARNRGISVAKGKIIAFTDSDTAPFSDWLQNILNVMRDSRVGIIVGNLQYSSDSRPLSLIANYEYERALYTFSSNIKEIYYGYTCNMVVRKTLFDNMGPFPEVYRNSDIVFLLRALDEYSCDVVRYSPEVRVQRLEISTLWKYYGKQYIYGRDFQRYVKVASARPLNNSERFRIFQNTVKKGRYSIVKTVFLFSLLCAGGMFYESGRLLASNQ